MAGTDDTSNQPPTPDERPRPTGPQITQILQGLGHNPTTNAELVESVYDELKMIARRHMSRERSDHTLQATALVNEAYMRLIGDEPVSWENRGHFYAAAAESMRRILIDHARKKGRQKRGGDRRRVPIDLLDLAREGDSDDILAIDEAIVRLEKEDARAASVVRLRFYAGLSVEQTAKVLNVSERTVMREWRFARAALYRNIFDEDVEEGGT